MPKIAFLPFNVTEPVRPAFGRMLAHFISEAYKIQPEVETHFVSYLTQVGTPEDQEMALVNIAEELNDVEFLGEVIEQTQSDWVVDGTLKAEGTGYRIQFRVSKKGLPGASLSDRTFEISDVFNTLRWMITELATTAGIVLLPEFAEKMEFGTDDAEAFYNFLMGFDAIHYVQQAGPRVAKQFDVTLAFDSLLSAVERDKEFLGPFEATLQLAQLCAAHQVGTPIAIESKLKRLIELEPNDWRGTYTLGDFQAASGRLSEAAENYEKSARLLEKERDAALAKRTAGEDVTVPEIEPAIYTRLAITQQQLNMVANAERNFKKAIELEGPQKPSMDFLAILLQQNARSHEVPALWKNLVDANPKNGYAWAKYAVSLMQDQREDEGKKAFDEGLKVTEGDVVVKRFYAPYLSGKGELDAAMDLYEDALDEVPNDVQVNLEYAQTLAKAERTHEIPDVLRRVLASEPDADTRANTQAWLYELEQPKRIETLARAQQLTEKEEFGKAIAELEPLTTWMGDYWKLWAMLSSLYNRTQQFEEAEKSAIKVLEIFPGCEPAFGELAGALVGQGRAEEAYTMLAGVLQARPNSAVVALNLAMAAKQTGRNEEASRLAKMLREAAGPGNVELEQVLSQLERI